MLGKWPFPAKLPETRALKVSALDQVIEVRTLEGRPVPVIFLLMRNQSCWFTASSAKPRGVDSLVARTRGTGSRAPRSPQPIGERLCWRALY